MGKEIYFPNELSLNLGLLVIDIEIMKSLHVGFLGYQVTLQVASDGCV